MISAILDAGPRILGQQFREKIYEEEEQVEETAFEGVWKKKLRVCVEGGHALKTQW